jgi:hypothetical protein
MVPNGAVCLVPNMDVLVDNAEFCSVFHDKVVARECCDGYLMAGIL